LEHLEVTHQMSHAQAESWGEIRAQKSITKNECPPKMP